MFQVRTVGAALGLGLWVSAIVTAQPQKPGWAGEGAGRPVEVGRSVSTPKPLLTGSVDPKLFGTLDHSITVLSALDFNSVTCPFVDAPTLSNLCVCNSCTEASHLYATLDLPAGAVIDYIGVNNATPVDASMGFTFHFRDHLGGHAELTSFSFPAHEAFVTDFAGPLGILVPGNHDRAFILDVERAPVDGISTYFGYVEIWWRRVVSDPPATPTFGDVPSTHPFYQFVEALAKSGITGGCAGGNFCPDSLLTRGQMAVFLSKALGLHWPE